MTLAIIMVKNIFPLHTNLQTNFSNIPIYYTKWHNVNKIMLLMLMIVSYGNKRP